MSSVLVPFSKLAPWNEVDETVVRDGMRHLGIVMSHRLYPLTPPPWFIKKKIGLVGYNCELNSMYARVYLSFLHNLAGDKTLKFNAIHCLDISNNL